MLNQETKKRIDSARDILVGKVPDPKAQVEQITTALIYKFMDDIDKESEELGGKARFFTGEYEKYSWTRLLDRELGGFDRLNLYSEALAKMPLNPNLPKLFRDILKDAFLPYRDSETLNLFLKEINSFTYEHSEKLGDAYEYLLSILGSQGDAGQFRTPRHIIDFVVKVVDPKKDESVLDPACGTAGFLISAYKHILQENTKERVGDLLSNSERKNLMNQFLGYDISPDMVRLSLTNMYLHSFPNPNIFEYDTLTSEERWGETYDVILANPPFMTPKGGIRPHKHFAISANRSELLFVDYITEHLNINGRAGIIVPEGIVSTNSSGYLTLRKIMVTQGYLYAVISLPSGIFKPYAGVKTNILFFDKYLAKEAKDILFIEINSDGFTLTDTRQPIEENDLPLALKLINKFKESIRNKAEFNLAEEESKRAILVNKTEIAKTNSFNLIGKRYRTPQMFSDLRWPMTKLADVCLIEKGKSPTLKTLPGPYPLVVTAEARRTSNHYDFDTSATCIPLISSTGHGHASIKRLQYQEGKFALANTMCALIPKNSNILNAKYLYYVLSAKIEESVVPLMKGAANVSLHISELDQVLIPLPPVEYQIQIVEEVNRYKKIIDGAKQVVENYKPTVVIDANWEFTRLENVVDFLSGLTLSIPHSEDQNGTPIISMNSITKDGEIITEGIRKIRLPQKENIHYLQNGDLLFNWRNGSKELVGKTGFFKFDGKYVFASFLLGVRPKRNVLDSKYLWILLNNYRKEGKYMQFMRQNINGLFNREELKEVEIPLPPIEDQKRIISQYEKEQSLIDANKTLIEIFEQKIKDKIDEFWQVETSSTETSVQEEINIEKDVLEYV